jgi:hypothetical protein
MRKVMQGSLAVVGVLLVMAGSARAQVPAAAGVVGGIDFAAMPKAGQVFDEIIGNSSSDTSSKIGAAFGGFVEFKLSEPVSFAPGLMFVMKGVNLDESGDLGTVTARVNYLEFPLLVRIGAPMSAGRAYVFAGPNFGLKASTGGELKTSDTTVDLGEDIDPAIRSFEAGLIFGAGIERGVYLIEVRYTLGLTDVMTNIYPHANAVHNRVFTALAGLRFK